MKKLLLLLLLTLGCISVANADDAFTISDVFQIFPALWSGVKVWFFMIGSLVVMALHETSLGQFFEVDRYSEEITIITSLVYWIGGLFLLFSILEYIDKLDKSPNQKTSDKIASWLFWGWFFFPAILGYILSLMNGPLDIMVR